ncbi:hypothetical protein NE237_026412 [Protea cynaroides]|uniref:Uncharacterized protein n=1 Tax=Protea cynaroides TaxID=273540 RepID=A0A9Q0H3P5_9MAGN|nr:hypothetical protein NE237_026412 [Protea cynaroides]
MWLVAVKSAKPPKSEDELRLMIQPTSVRHKVNIFLKSTGSLATRSDDKRPEPQGRSRTSQKALVTLRPPNKLSVTSFTEDPQFASINFPLSSQPRSTSTSSSLGADVITSTSPKAIRLTTLVVASSALSVAPLAVLNSTILVMMTFGPSSSLGFLLQRWSTRNQSLLSEMLDPTASPIG